SYEVSDWTNDFNRAKAIGIDGFALNIASDSDYEPAKIVDAYQVAEVIGFSLFFSFDMSYSWTPYYISTIMAASSSMSKWNNAVLMSTFDGSDEGETFWAAVKSNLGGKGITVSVTPAFIKYKGAGCTGDKHVL
ncbi:glycoside hydrolase, partial [Mycena floridula]